jgi:hypothetical protein
MKINGEEKSRDTVPLTPGLCHESVVDTWINPWELDGYLCLRISFDTWIEPYFLGGT